MKVIIFILLFTSLYSQDIDSLLQSYQAESELSNKTKDESAGNLIVYTRDDLERMQVESLKDILKSLRFFTYHENRIAQPDILNQDPLVYYSKSIRVYLNENELLTAISGSGLISFGDMEMDFIDHVEIYQGFPSFDFGVEPATIVIRLYTKNPVHDEGGRVKAIVGTHGTNKQNVYYANTEDEVSYFMYANHTDERKDRYKKDAEILKRDKVTNRFYSSLEFENHKVEFHAMQAKGDAFLGSLIGSIPEQTTVKSRFINATLNSKFMNDTLSVNLSYIHAESDFSYKYDPTTPITIITPPGISFINTLDQNIKEEAFSASVKKDFSIENHDISFGMQFRYKYFDLADVVFDIPITPVEQAYFRENIYSFFLQDLISINENHMISISLMNQIYERDGNVDDPNTNQFRLGYIYTNESFVWKTFLSHQEFASEPYMTISPHYGNSSLKPETYKAVFQEFSYQPSEILYKMILGYGVNEDIPILDSSFIMQNSNVKIESKSAALELTYYFREKDKLELQTSYTYIQSPYDKSTTEHYAYVVRMLNTVAKYDFFNELIIQSGYSNVSSGYDYSFGIRYAFSKDLYIQVKGENVFDSALEQSFITKSTPTVESINVPIIERRFLFGLEYLF